MPPTQRGTCANCGTALAGAFCHVCGQEAVELHPPLRHLVREGLGDLLAFDSRILRTLGPLLLRPGLLSREWSGGRRAPFVPPLRLYLFIAALFFLLLALTEVTLLVTVEGSGGAKRFVTTAEVAQIQIDTRDGEAGDGEASAGEASETAAADGADEARGNALESAAPDARSNASPSEGAGTPAGEAEAEALTGFGDRLKAALSHDPGGFQNDLVDRLGRVSLLMPPVFALLLAVVYRGRRRVLVEHAVTSLHLHAFVFLFLGVVLVVSYVVDGRLPMPLRMLVLATLAGYLFLALRRVYGGRWWVTLLRTATLLLLYMLVIFLPTLLLALVWTVYSA